MFWRAVLPKSEETKQDQGLKEEVVSLRLKMSEQEEALKDAMERLKSSNRTKDSMEHFIVNQLSRTRDVLQKAKTNLQENELRISSLRRASVSLPPPSPSSSSSSPSSPSTSSSSFSSSSFSSPSTYSPSSFSSSSSPSTSVSLSPPSPSSSSSSSSSPSSSSSSSSSSPSTSSPSSSSHPQPGKGTPPPSGFAVLDLKSG
ncbi:myomegalin isoform X2 [Scomber scombrus]